MLMGYARGSTADRRDTAVQVKVLPQAGADRVFEEPFVAPLLHAPQRPQGALHAQRTEAAREGERRRRDHHAQPPGAG